MGATGGASVTTWNDQSGVGNHLSQATGSNCPNSTLNLINYNPALRFDGNDLFNPNFAVELSSKT